MKYIYEASLEFEILQNSMTGIIAEVNFSPIHYKINGYRSMLVTSCDLYWELLAFRVTPKVFIPFLEVLHEMWGAWYMVDPWCFAMYLHIGGVLLKLLHLVWMRV